jgi:hypothetical protein
LLRRRPERDPAPIIIGGTIAFLALVIVIVFVVSALLGGDGGGDPGGTSGDPFQITEGITALRAKIPGLPPGLETLSEYFEFEAKDEDTAAIIGLPLREQLQDPVGVGFYTFFEGRWQRLADVTLFQEGRAAEGDFNTVPKNLAVLRVIAQTYQAAGSLPAGTTLHPDAQINILSPRDYSPSADGSVQGQATDVSAATGLLLMPTIVASGEDTAAVVNDILADESLRQQHIDAILSLVNGTDLDGIDLEYSSVDEDLQVEFTDFVNKLADGLQEADRRLSLTLPPPTNQRSAYAWKALGEKVNIIKILPLADPTTYWQTMPGAMSQLVQDVDPRKVMLIVSPFSVEVGDSARPIGYRQAMLLAAEAVVREPQNPDDIKPGVTVKLVARNLDPEEGASPLRWDEDAAALSFASGGTDRKRIFIENGFSVAFKLEIVQAYGLGGLALSDASAQSDVANIWPTVKELLSSATVSLLRPNETALLPGWRASAGDIGAGAGTTATWIPKTQGPHDLILVVSDGQTRFGRKLVVEVKKATETSPTPNITFAPETPTPGPTPLGTAVPTPSPSVRVEVGLLADGDDPGETFSNDEQTSPGSTITYLVTIDNDGDKPVTVSSLVDTGGDVVCASLGGVPDVVGITLDPDDGDGPGTINGGNDEVQCKYTETAPSQPNKERNNSITGTAKAEDGSQGSDTDSAKITTKP